MTTTTGMMIFALGVAACAVDVPDELADENGDDGGKADGTGAFDYWQLELSDGGYRVSRPNRTVTDCGDGVRAKTCNVASLDLEATAMPASVANGFADRANAGEALLLRGELAPESPQLALARLSKTAGSLIASADLAPALPTTSPSIHVGDGNGPDCLYARLFVDDVDINDAVITMTPAGTGTLRFDARFGGVAIPSRTEHAVACVDGTSTLTIKIATLTASGVVSIAADGALKFDASYRLDGLTFDAAVPPPAPVIDMVSNDVEIGNIVMSSVANALAPQVKPERALAATEIWVPGSRDAADLSGVFVLASRRGDGIVERRVNSTKSAAIDEIDLAASGAADAALQDANAELASGGEVMLVGFRYSHGGKRGRAANQFWTKAPVPLH